MQMDNAGERTASEWLNQNMGAIVEFSIRAGAVAYQGARIADAEEQLKPGEPKSIALAQLHDELKDEYAAMLAARQTLPAADELQRRADAAQAELAEATREDSALHVIVSAEVHEAEDEVEQAAALVPAAEQQLMAYMRERIAQLIGTRGAEQAWRQHDAAEMVEQYAGALAMMSFVPVPHHLSEEERAEIEAQVAANARSAAPAVVLPLDIHALAAAVREANPAAESRGLNTLAALIFLQNPSGRFTAAEVGSVLYEGDDPVNAANKAGALLHHSLNQGPGGASRILAENGYMLVRETAAASEQAGEGRTRPTRVYGLVPIEEQR